MNAVADTQILLLLCSRLAITSESMQPYKLSEWNQLAQKIANSAMKRPNAFLQMDSGQWQSHLNLPSAEVMRIERLLSRAGQLAIELERLNNMGIWVTSRADSRYPARLKKILKQQAPVVLFGAGNPQLSEKDGIGVVGSRDVDQHGVSFAEQLGVQSATEGLTVISGGAKGVDTIAQQSAIHSGGQVVAFPSEGLELVIRKKEVRQAVLDGQLTLLSAVHPKLRFTAGSAMGRNKFIYALSLYTVVVSSSYNKGGTWNGAIENLNHQWVPMFVRSDEYVPEGNLQLLAQGGVPLPTKTLIGEDCNLRDWLAAAASTIERKEQAETTGDTDDQIRSALDTGRSVDSTAEAVDLYHVAWPYIEALIKIERSADELAQILRLQPSQMQVWLERAVRENKAKRVTNSSKYIDMANSPVEQVAFDFMSK